MKKLSMMVAAFALAVPAPFMFASPAQAGSNSSVSAFCKSAPGFSSVGECVSLLTTRGNGSAGYAAQYCSYMQDHYAAFFSHYYAAYSDCVQDGAYELLNAQGSGSDYV